MPGVFYSSQSPEKPPYVKVGDTIKDWTGIMYY